MVCAARVGPFALRQALKADKKFGKACALLNKLLGDDKSLDAVRRLLARRRRVPWRLALCVVSKLCAGSQRQWRGRGTGPGTAERFRMVALACAVCVSF